MFNRNKYAFASTDFNENINNGLKATDINNEGIWFRPYTSWENIPLKHGPKVDSLTYGAFIGGDSDFIEHRHGWHSVWSAYAGYHGGQIDYRGVDTTLNGGALGLTDTFYKGNFWTAVTATAGAVNAETSTMYGHDNTTSLIAGIASKTGYNFEFKDGSYILQPIMEASYSFANMFDYTNSAGLKIKSEPMHTIQLHPAFRFIWNCKNGWQPYAKAGVVWNLINNTDVTAGGYQLPSMHIKPYAEYGLGVQRLYNDRFMGFGQAMVRNGGRNGVALTFGLRYALGDDSSYQTSDTKKQSIIKNKK
jgi:outer membrane autotransporter protein